MAAILASSGASVILVLVYIAVLVVYVVAAWTIFTKAGKPGWACLIPFYNYYVLLKIVGRPGWWLILYFIPIVNFVIFIIVMLDLSKSFGHGTPYALGLIFLGFIFALMLAFGPSRYLGPAAQAETAGSGGGYPGQGSHAQGYPAQPAQGYPAQPAQGYPAQPAQGYPAQPAQGYPAQAPPAQPQQPPAQPQQPPAQPQQPPPATQ